MADMQQYFAFANANKTCFFATVEDDQPRVRGLAFWKADASGFYFQIGGMKEMCLQLQKNPKAEVCFYGKDDGGSRMLRVAGSVEFVNDRALKEQVIAERPFLKDMGLTADSPDLIILRIAHGEAHFWAKSVKQKEIVTF